MRLYLGRLLPVLLACSFVTFACSKKKSDDDDDDDDGGGNVDSGGGGGGGDGGTVTPRFVTAGVSGDGAAFALAGERVAHSTMAQLKSLQYYVSRIDLCESIEVTGGTGYNNPTNCVTLFGAAGAPNSYDDFKIAQAAADTSASWVDLVSKDSVGKDFATGASVTPRSYQYVIIETRKPIKVNASLTLGGQTLKTCAGGTAVTSGAAESLFEATTIADMTTCTQALATLGSIGGGKFFKLQTPITVAAGESYALDMAFNPNGAIAGGVADAGWGDKVAYSDGTYSMVPTSLSIVPILRKASEKTIREQYELSGIAGVDGTVVVDLYFAGALTDVGSGAVIGAGVRFLNAADAQNFVQMYQPYAMEVSAAGALTLKSWDGKNIVAGLVRSTTQTAGATSTVSVDVGAVKGTGTTTTATVTFKGVTAL